MSVIKVLVVAIWLTTMSNAIRFNFQLQPYQIQCFHQSVEKDSRYQIGIKGQTSNFYLHVIDQKAVHEDTRTKGAQYKYYSAFAQHNNIITFCIGNLGQTSIYFDIEFYHGMFLQDSFTDNVQGKELTDLAQRWTQMLKMVESNYQIYRGHLFSRRANNDRIALWLTIMAIVMVVGTLAIKSVYYTRIVRYLKQKKAV